MMLGGEEVEEKQKMPPKGIRKRPPRRYRDQPEILLEILRLCAVEGGAHKTRVMYGAALSYRQANDYLSQCFDRKLLWWARDTKTFRLTEKGLKAMRALEEWRRLLMEEELP